MNVGISYFSPTHKVSTMAFCTAAISHPKFPGFPSAAISVAAQILLVLTQLCLIKFSLHLAFALLPSETGNVVFAQGIRFHCIQLSTCLPSAPPYRSSPSRPIHPYLLPPLLPLPSVYLLFYSAPHFPPALPILYARAVPPAPAGFFPSLCTSSPAPWFPLSPCTRSLPPHRSPPSLCVPHVLHVLHKH